MTANRISRDRTSLLIRLLSTTFLMVECSFAGNLYYYWNALKFISATICNI
jgi:hypothetical protein